MSAAGRPRRRYTRTLVLYGGLALATLVIGFIAGHVAGAWMLRKELRAWEATGTSMDALRARWPRRADSAAALELDRLARPLGLRLVRPAGGPAPIGEKASYEAVGRWLGQLYKRKDDGYDAAPAEVRAFLESHRAELSAVAAHLHGASDITWATDIAAGFEAPVPSLLAHRYFNNLLVAEALERSGRGDVEGAERMLDAAWRHGETLASRPELISQLIAIGLTGQHGNVLRRVAGASPSWTERLNRRRFLPAVIDTFQYEAHTFLTVAETYRGTSDRDVGLIPWEGPLGRPVRVATGPWMRISLSSASGHCRRAQELARAADACRVAGDALQTAFESGMGRWDLISRIAVPSTMRTVTTGASADLDSELTRLVLQARQQGAASDVPSRVCPSVTWRQARESDGRWTIRAEPPVALDANRPDRWTFTVSSAAPTPRP